MSCKHREAQAVQELWDAGQRRSLSRTPGGQQGASQPKTRRKKKKKKASWMLLGSIFIPPWNLVSCLPVGTWWLRKRRRRNKVEEEEANFSNVHFPQKDVCVFESLCPGGAALKQRRGFASSSKRRRPNYNSQLRLSVALCIADCHAGCWLQNKFPRPGVEPRPGSYCRKKTKTSNIYINIFF